MSDLNGRRPSYIICFIIYIVANIGLALQTNYAALLVLRMVQAFGCSAAIALATAVVADIATSSERGTYMGYASAGLLIGPAFGPTIGGLLAQYLVATSSAMALFQQKVCVNPFSAISSNAGTERNLKQLGPKTTRRQPSPQLKSHDSPIHWPPSRS